MENLTLEQLRQGDIPQAPLRKPKGDIRWWEVGPISASKINYGDFTVNKGSMAIGVGEDVFTADLNGIALGSATWASANFRVDMSGNAYLESANITGSITATSGTIGGFTITPTTMYGGIIKTSQTAGAGANGIVMDSDGLRGYSSTLGEVFNIPTDGSAPTFSSGVINSTVFEINTNAVLRTSETVGDGSADSAGVLINDTGIYATEANQTLENANVQILATGEATFSGFVKGGMTDYLEGTGYFLGFNSGVYKLAIGDPDANYLSWNGEQLRIKGIVELDGPITLENYATADLPVPPTNPGLTLAGAYE